MRDVNPRAPHVVSFSIPLHQHMLATGRFVTSLPRSLLQFAKHLPLARLSVDMPALPDPSPAGPKYHS
jgi:hypothetical protein